MSAEIDEKSGEEHSGEEKSWPWWIVALLVLIACGLFSYFAYSSIFEEYTIYYKDESFLGHAQYTNAIVVKHYSNQYEKTYTFDCGKGCTEHYKEKKLGRLKYEANGVEYENDVWVVYKYDFKHMDRDVIRLPDEGRLVNILYNLENPNDIRLQNDLMIKEMSGSWFSLHGHWRWVVIWGIVGLASGALALGMIIILVVVPLLGLISKEK